MMRRAGARITVYNCIMRTTLTIDDDVLEAARCIADAQGIPLGQAVSNLARKGIPEVRLITAADGFPVFDIDPADFPRLTNEDVADILAEFP